MEFITLCLPWFCTLLKTSSISHSHRLHFGQDVLFGLSSLCVLLSCTQVKGGENGTGMQVFYLRTVLLLEFSIGNLFSRMGLALKRESELTALGSTLASGAWFGCAMQLPRAG